MAAVLGRLLAAGNTYVKLFGFYLSSQAGYPSYSGVGTFAGGCAG
jgi:hypothetical protein